MKTLGLARIARRLFVAARAESSAPMSLAARLAAQLGATLALAFVGSRVLFAGELSDELVPSLPQGVAQFAVLTLLFPAANLVLLLLPSLLAFVFVRPGTTWRLFGTALATLGGLYALFDYTLYRRFGRHLSDILAYVGLPEGAAAAGNTSKNLLLVAVAVAWGLVFGVSYLLLTLAARRLASKLGVVYHRLLVALFASLAATLVASLWFMVPLLPDGFGQRLYASLPIRPVSLIQNGRHEPHDPMLRELQSRLRREYERLFPFVFSHHERRQAPSTRVPSPPDIAVVVAESLRWQQLTPEIMPRLFEWSKRGLRADRHYAGSNHSESGLFVLLYSESPLRFNTTLDQKTPPTLCRLLRSSDYRCGYYTGHPKVWLRREEFLNEHTMDDFVHDDSGTWNAWDARALGRSAQALAEATRRFSLTFLMSSHFEYRYPEAYRKHLPDDAPATSWKPGLIKRDEYEACRNRYMNVSAYLDDLVADYVEKLGDDTIVIFTGDHGEGTGEHGKFGHGYSFSDPLTRVPFIMVGPGIEPTVRSELSSHHDILPTLLDVLGIPSPGDNLGDSLLATPNERALLSTYTSVGHLYAEGLLISGDLRLSLRFDPIRPLVDVVGLETPEGFPSPHVLSPGEVDGLVRAFVDQLERAGRPAF